MERTRPQIDAQRIILADAWASFCQPNSLQPGMDVVEKPGLGFPREGHDPYILKLWRLLDPSDAQDMLIIDGWIQRYPLINKLDCIVAHVADDGGTLVFEPHELAQLMPAPT